MRATHFTAEAPPSVPDGPVPPEPTPARVPAVVALGPRARLWRWVRNQLVGARLLAGWVVRRVVRR